jgi:hypothetical protein
LHVLAALGGEVGVPPAAWQRVYELTELADGRLTLADQRKRSRLSKAASRARTGAGQDRCPAPFVPEPLECEADPRIDYRSRLINLLVDRKAAGASSPAPLSLSAGTTSGHQARLARPGRAGQIATVDVDHIGHRWPIDRRINEVSLSIHRTKIIFRQRDQ